MSLPAHPAALVIYNAHSGSKTDEDFEKLLAEKSELYNFRFLVYEIEKDDCEGSIIKLIADFKPDFLIAAGGDGTLNLVAKIAPDRQLPVLILPYGSANGMARELGIPNQISAAYNVLENYKIKPIDLLNINNFTCVHLADVGLNAHIVKRFQEDSKRGLITYARHLFHEVFLLKSRRFLIDYDGKSIKRKSVSITFANATKYGTGATINPTGKVDDGIFELCVVKPFPFFKIISITWKMFRGNLQTSEYFELIKCKQAKIHSKRSILLQVDGEVIGKVKQIDITIRPQVLKLLLPADFQSKLA